MTWTFLIVPVLVGAVSVAILARTTQKLLDLTDGAEAATVEAASGQGQGNQGDAR
jgi:hypothetical protein